MRLITRFLTFFFHHLYHGLAFIYDAIAGMVSFGQWNEWTKTTLPFLTGTRILELGHGPGHLQHNILQSLQTLESPSAQNVKSRDFTSPLESFVVGLDESSQMSRLARKRLHRSGYTQPNLTRGLGQFLPFATESFDSLVATFPAPYIAEAQTLSEARRVLRNGGRLIVLPAAWPKNPILKWLYHFTGESPAEGIDILKEKSVSLLARAGFTVKVEIVEVKSAELLLIVAIK